jgi:signal transduction histidine kinase
MTAEKGTTVIVEDTAQEPNVTQAIIKPENIRSFVQVPIKIEDEVFGVFSVDYTSPRSFEREEIRLMLALAQRAAIAIQNAQLYEGAQELAATRERSRLARDLHDAVTQTLFSASLIAEALPALWERNPEKGRDRLAKLRQLNRGALAEMRTLLLELRPAALMESSFDDLVRQLAESAIGRTGIPVVIHIEGKCRLPAEVHLPVYRIIQEALNNAVKHANASQIEIDLFCTSQQDGKAEALKLSISDDGKGFDPKETAPEKLGLTIMRERAQSIGAELTLESQPGKGTHISLSWQAVR